VATLGLVLLSQPATASAAKIEAIAFLMTRTPSP
jgi:hypothetical protein